ncbi:MAG TPA: chemotaxis protein CheA [Candidatus Acidoferrales bacterium]|nr:chemotaxis protein CheA [Candidatus Acidoferrales bacterium]
MNDEPFDRAELLRYFKDESDELLQQIDADLLALEPLAASSRTDSERINSLFRALHTIKGSAGMLELADVSTFSHKLESVCDLMRNGSLALSNTLIEVLFEGRDHLTSLIRAGIEGTGQPDTAGFAERLEAVVLRQSRADSEEHQISAERTINGGGKVRPRTIRVDIARLDVLLDLVGELVITKNRIVQITALLTRGDGTDPAKLVSELNSAAALLARTSTDLQEAVMHSRMVRIAGVFERFPRVVRDLAKSRGKEIELTIEGAETDLDKTIVDEIGEPLMHLVRNCVDHGIESPKRRRECGKDPIGKIELRAAHEGNSVVVQVRDDGGGVDLERVRDRGLTLGLISADSVQSERELLELLFVPGFSTARSVSELSGRGVGMDVVRRAIGGLSGTLEVASRRGVGTTFTIRLPLTLAILGALLVRIAGELYAIPLDAVSESLRLESAQVARSESGETILHRDRLLPVIRGAEFFELGDLPGETETVLVVVLRAANREMGLIVDEFVGDQEIVVKPLSELVGPISGIAGGTILGDGSIALILDPNALVNEVNRGPGSILISGVMHQR